MSTKFAAIHNSTQPHIANGNPHQMEEGKDDDYNMRDHNISYFYWLQFFCIFFGGLKGVLATPLLMLPILYF
jgi:hypothetical protein